MGNTEMIQLLGATDQMKMNILDARDRNCMHYAAIKGKQTLINTLFLLFKSHGGRFQRAELDPEAVRPQYGEPVVDESELSKINKDIEEAQEDEAKDEADEEKNAEDEELKNDEAINIKLNPDCEEE